MSAAFVATLLVFVAAIHAQETTPVLMPRSAEAYLVAGIGQKLNQAANGAVAARSLSTQANQDGTKRMAEVRSAFWQQFPDSERFDEVAKLFANELFKKDVAMAGQLGMIRMTSSGRPAGFGRPAIDLSTLTKKMFDRIKNYDGGIAPGARRSFDTWLEASFPTAERTTFSDTLALSKAFTEHRELYDSYVVARNRYEYWKAGNEKEFFPTADSFATYMCQAGWVSGNAYTLKSSIKWAKSLESDFGQAAYQEVLMQLRNASKTQRGGLTETAYKDLKLDSGHLKDAMVVVLGRTSLENYALSLLYENGSTKKTLKELYKKYGQDKTLECAKLVRDAPTTTTKHGERMLKPGLLKDVGARTRHLGPAFLEILSFEDRKKSQPNASTRLVGIPSKIGEKIYSGQRMSVAPNGQLFLLNHDQSSKKLELIVLATSPKVAAKVIDVTPKRHSERRRPRGDRRTWYKNHFVLSNSHVFSNGKTALIQLPSYCTDETPGVGAIKVVDLESGSVSEEIVGPSREGRGVGFGSAAALGENYFAVSAVNDNRSTGRVVVYKIGQTKPSYTIESVAGDYGSIKYSIKFGTELAIVGEHLIIGIGDSDESNGRPRAAVYNIETGKRVSSIGSRRGMLLFSETQVFVVSNESIAPVDLSTGEILDSDGFSLSKRYSILGVTGKTLVVDKAKNERNKEFAGLSLIDVDTGKQVGYFPLKGKAIEGNQSGRPARESVDIQLSRPVVENGFFANLGNNYSSGHLAWFVKLHTGIGPDELE